MTQIQRELLIFVAIPVAYSVGFFGWCYLAEKMAIFSKRNAKPPTTVICGHAAVLLSLIFLTQITIQSYPALPNWLTDGSFHLRGSPASVFEVSCIIAVLLIGWAEKQWIYVDSDADQSEIDNK
jgi:hypothetical protein